MSLSLSAILRLIVFMVLAGNAWAAQAKDVLTLGVFAFRPKPVMEKLYQPLADYLGQAVPGVQIRLLVLDPPEMEAALAAHQLDLLFTNPGHFVLLRHRNRLTGAIATLVALERDIPTAALGGVIVTRTDRTDIAALADLRGKNIALPGTKYLGGYQTQAFELQQVGIRLPRDARLSAIGSHDGVVQAVLAGTADVGFIRTGIVEAALREGLLQPGQLKVINPQQQPDFPFQLSTRLYPEWAFAALPHVNERLVRRLSAALMAIEPDHPAAKAAGIQGFTVPADYLPVEELARTLRLPPFEDAPDFTLHDIFSRYREAIIGGAVACVIIVLLAGQLALSNRRLTRARRRAEESEEVFHRLYEDAPRPVLILKDGRFERCNQAALDLLGRSREDFIGKSPAEISPEFQPDGRPSAAASAAILAATKDDKPLRFDWTHSRADGAPFVVDVSLTPIILGGERLAYCGWTEITDRTRAEAEVKDANSRLAEQARKLMQVNEELELFASVASHDLRQPLRMVSSYLSLIKRELGGTASTDIKEFLDFAVDGAKRMDRLILDLLEYSRSGRQTTPPAPVALSEAVEVALQHLQVSIGDAGAEITVEPQLPVITGHASDLIRLFQNLIGNAVKYRDRDRIARIEIGGRPNSGTWLVWVRDNGPGIPPEDHDRIFKIFQRLSSAADHDGSGIGLAVCKKIVDHLGGDIWIESTPGEGTTFFMSFPA